MAREPLGAAGARHDAELDFRLAETAVSAAMMKSHDHGQLAAAAQRITGDRGDHGLRRLLTAAKAARKSLT